MSIIGQITVDWSSPAAKVVMVVAGLLALYLAIKIGHFILKVLFGLAGLALLGAVFWWLFFRH